MIIADTGKRKVALFVDTVTGIKDLSTRQFVNSKENLPFAEYIKGVAKVDNELILIYDLEQFLSLDEEKELEQALKQKNK
jgi:purine-binding chemotaxis protein CheW